jgi:hypothetical protein
MRIASSVVLTGFLLVQATPAFAYQARNWPGMVIAPEQPAMMAPSDPNLTFMSSGAVLPVSGTDDDDANPLTRAEFTKLLIDSLYPASVTERCLGRLVYKEAPDYRLLFSDTSIEHAAAKEICMAMRTGLVRGYADGTFRPEQRINFAEASKLLARAFALVPFPVDARLTWYMPYSQSLADRNVIPQTVSSYDAPLTTADLREMLERIRLTITWRPSLSALDLQRKTEKMWKAAR